MGGRRVGTASCQSSTQKKGQTGASVGEAKGEEISLRPPSRKKMVRPRRTVFGEIGQRTKVQFCQREEARQPGWIFKRENKS